jgi:hypothetical protein
MQRLLNDRYAKLGQLVGEFRETYDEESARATPPKDERPPLEPAAVGTGSRDRSFRGRPRISTPEARHYSSPY